MDIINHNIIEITEESNKEIPPYFELNNYFINPDRYDKNCKCKECVEILIWQTI